MDVVDDADGSLDPRIQVELENLNNATDDINKLETELDEAHTAFRQLLSESTRRLKEILDKLGSSCIERARCYYEALEVARQAQVRCQQQAQLFQRASEIHAAAKETVALAEARFMSHQHEWNFDQAWQDMLNHATLKVMDAENQKAECGREHHRRALLFHDAEKRLLHLEEKHRRSIIKARPYFEVKAHCDQMLATQKERVECLQRAIKEAKKNYAASLRTLEEISNQIHQQRRDYDMVASGPREPGVGAELENAEEQSSSQDQEFVQTISSRPSCQARKDIRQQDPIKEVDEEHLDKRSVDGSEATAPQWELELQVSLDNLNNLSLDNGATTYEPVKTTQEVPSVSRYPQIRLPDSLNHLLSKNLPLLQLSRLKGQASRSLTSSPRSRATNATVGQRTEDRSRSEDDLNLGWNLNVDGVEAYAKSEGTDDERSNEPGPIDGPGGQVESKIGQGRPRIGSRSANSSPAKPKPRNPDRKVTDLGRYAVLKTLASKTANVRELPLLSFFDESRNRVQGTRTRSAGSLVSLDDKKSLSVLLDNADIADGIQAISAKRLATARDSLFQKVPR